MRDLECNTWEGSDEELDNVLEKLNQDSITCEKQYLKVQRDNNDIFEICNTIIAASKPTVTRPRNPAGAGITPAVPNISFKPQTDLKPTFLVIILTLEGPYGPILVHRIDSQRIKHQN